MSCAVGSLWSGTAGPLDVVHQPRYSAKVKVGVWRKVGATLLKVHVLGRLTVSTASASFDERDLPGQQGTLLLAFLVLERNPSSRERVADMLWSGSLPAEWNRALSSLTSKIRKLLDCVGLGRESLLTTSGTIQLVLPVNTWVDVEAALANLEEARNHQLNGSVQQSLPVATAAWSVLQRPLLEGLDNAWSDSVRARLDRQRYEVCELLAVGWLNQGDPQLAITIAESMIESDEIRERGYQLVISAATQLGDHALAAQAYARCKDTLERELGIRPAQATTALLPTRTAAPSSELAP